MIISFSFYGTQLKSALFEHLCIGLIVKLFFIYWKRKFLLQVLQRKVYEPNEENKVLLIKDFVHCLECTDLQSYWKGALSSKGSLRVTKSNKEDHRQCGSRLQMFQD